MGRLVRMRLLVAGAGAVGGFLAAPVPRRRARSHRLGTASAGGADTEGRVENHQCFRSASASAGPDHGRKGDRAVRRGRGRGGGRCSDRGDESWTMDEPVRAAWKGGQVRVRQPAVAYTIVRSDVRASAQVPLEVLIW